MAGGRRLVGVNPAKVRSVAIVVVLTLAAGGCTTAGPVVGVDSPAVTAGVSSSTTTTTPSVVTTTPSTTTAPTTTTTSLPAGVVAPPVWLGTRVLPLRDDGFGEIQPTPPELVDRRFATIDLLPPPTGEGFEWTLGPVPDDVVARSSWTPECPVTADELSYLTVTFWGFDERPHTGELIVNASYDEAMVEVFRTLYEARFPIEEMRVIRLDEIDAPPTGDGNGTGILECRPASGGTSWSMHAYGLAIDINPFHNPYLKNDVVLPELASAYTDRGDLRPGMIQPGDVVVQAFAQIGWSWGGDWNTLKDWMHFSANGR
jgi:hypothetical protein